MDRGYEPEQGLVRMMERSVMIYKVICCDECPYHIHEEDSRQEYDSCGICSTANVRGKRLFEMPGDCPLRGMDILITTDKKKRKQP